MRPPYVLPDAKTEILGFCPLFGKLSFIVGPVLCG